MAKALNAIVVSVEYRHAPEFKFPAQHDDAAAAYRWTLQNAASWGGDPAKIATVGESAGGNLAVATAIYARDNGLTAPRYIVSVYPIANSSMTLPSRQDSANAKPLNGAMLPWFGYYYQTSFGRCAGSAPEPGRGEPAWAAADDDHQRTDRSATLGRRDAGGSDARGRRQGRTEGPSRVLRTSSSAWPRS